VAVLPALVVLPVAVVRAVAVKVAAAKAVADPAAVALVGAVVRPVDPRVDPQAVAVALEDLKAVCPPRAAVPRVVARAAAAAQVLQRAPHCLREDCPRQVAVARAGVVAKVVVAVKVAAAPAVRRVALMAVVDHLAVRQVAAVVVEALPGAALRVARP